MRRKPYRRLTCSSISRTLNRLGSMPPFRSLHGFSNANAVYSDIIIWHGVALGRRRLCLPRVEGFFLPQPVEAYCILCMACDRQYQMSCTFHEFPGLLISKTPLLSPIQCFYKLCLAMVRGYDGHFQCYFFVRGVSHTLSPSVDPRGNLCSRSICLVGELMPSTLFSFSGCSIILVGMVIQK